MTATFRRFFTGTGIVRRQGNIINGRRGTAGISDVVVRCSGLAAVTDDEVRRQIKSPVLNTPMEARQVFLGSSEEVQVRKGDHFVLGSRFYPIRSVEHWPLQDPHEYLLRLIVEVVDK